MKSANDFATLKLTCTMPAGTPGTDASPANPLARALRQLLREGRPFARISSCFFRDAQEGSVRWLGVFVRSAGDRVVFFPGHSTNVDHLHGFKSDTEVWKPQPFGFDHVSLEPDLKSWHVTSVDSREHLGRPTTWPLGGGRVLWFGLSVADAGSLQIVRSETVISAEVPERDSKRRMDVFSKARDGMAFPMLCLNTEHPASFGKGFLHFSVFVGPTGFEDYRGPEFGFPFGSPFLAASLTTELANLPLRLHRFSERVVVLVHLVLGDPQTLLQGLDGHSDAVPKPAFFSVLKKIKHDFSLVLGQGNETIMQVEQRLRVARLPSSSPIHPCAVRRECLSWSFANSPM